MKLARPFAAFFVVLTAVFLVHTDSNLWIVYPDRMVLKDKASPLVHVSWSAGFGAVYALLGVGLLVALEKFGRRK